MTINAGLDPDTLDLMLSSLDAFVAEALPERRRLDLDRDDVCPEETVRAMCGDDLGVHLVFVPEEYGGLDGGAFDSYRVCERLARVDLGLATSVFATFLGSDPILVGATATQRKEWLGRIAERGVLFAYGATEPEAGSDLGALTTTATPIETDGRVTGYRLTGRKQWISNGSIADVYTILALAPGGPSWFIVEKGTPGFSTAPPEDKHGIRLSNTAALFLDDVFVPLEHLVGGVEGRGLIQAQQVFGYTRVMVAAFGLGAGWEAVDRAIQYSMVRVQGGTTAGREAGLHPQADRAARGAPGGRPRLPRGDRDPTGRRPGRKRRAEHRGSHRQVPGDRVRQRRRRGRDPGARRLRVHPAVPGREDQAGRPDHHDLRGHLGDPGDDHRARPLAAAPQDRRRVLPRRGRRAGQPARSVRRAGRRPGPDLPRRGARRVPRRPG